MMASYFVGVFCGFAAAIAGAYIIGGGKKHKALPPHDPSTEA